MCKDNWNNAYTAFCIEFSFSLEAENREWENIT